MQFLLLIDVPIQERSCQISIHEVITLSIPQANYPAQYDISTKYLGVTQDAMMAVELSIPQFQTCRKANSQFCSITSPYQSLTKPPSCIAALYTKSMLDIALRCSIQIRKTSDISLPTQIAPDTWIITMPTTAPTTTMTLICPEKPMETITLQTPLHIFQLPMACSATSSNFYLPPRYEAPVLDVNISLHMANLHTTNISYQNFHIWTHLGNNRSENQLQHLMTIPSIPVHTV